MTSTFALDLTRGGVFICLTIYALESIYVTRKRGLWPLLPSLFAGSAALLLFVPTNPLGGLVAMFALVAAQVRPRWALPNGGSDSLLFVLVFGLSIGALFPPEFAHHAILLFVASVSTWTYVRAGWGKGIYPAWRSGEMLNWSLQSSSFSPTPQGFFVPAKIAAGLVIFFELSAPLVFIVPGYVYIFCILGFFFHLHNFHNLGLNRFFWTWIATYPALIYTATS